MFLIVDIEFEDLVLSVTMECDNLYKTISVDPTHLFLTILPVGGYMYSCLRLYGQANCISIIHLQRSMLDYSYELENPTINSSCGMDG